ncbi:hypothetical protein [Citrobacter braakii]|uniref:hypothetical protein n=1 Tax=Citrobacter braakii TaxID=57706 RepID=UPI00351D7CF0
MKKIAFGALLSCVAFSSLAEQQYGWGNIHFDYQSWDAGVKDLEYEQALIGIEGGIGFDWGEMYGSYDFDNILDDEGNQGQTANGEIHTYLWKPVPAYLQKSITRKVPTLKRRINLLGLAIPT